MAENTKEQIKAQKTISELLTEIGKKAAAIQETFEKQRDAAKDVESVITAQKNKMEGFEKTKWKKVKTSWGNPSDEILIASYGGEEICFIPRHSRGHKISPTNINRNN